MHDTRKFIQTRLLFPKACSHAVTLSYDDGVQQDRRMLEVLDRYGLKCTFNLSSGLLPESGGQWYLPSCEVAELYRGHEVAAHGLTHPWLTRCTHARAVYECVEDRHRLEKLVQYPIRGMAYPYGDYNEDVITALDAAGLRWCRTVAANGGFALPERFLEWHPTAHHSDPKLLERFDSFLKIKEQLAIFYLWGHSYEFDKDGGWSLLEKFCQRARQASDAGECEGGASIYFATNGEIYDYLKAAEQLVFSADETIAVNHSSLSLWLRAPQGAAVEVPSGAVALLG